MNVQQLAEKLGWKLLSILPKSELKRIRSAYIEKYYPEEA